MAPSRTYPPTANGGTSAARSSARRTRTESLCACPTARKPRSKHDISSAKRSDLDLHPHRKDERLVIGDIYEDCAYHPVLCTSVDYDEDLIEGISLIDGSEPRGCSLTHCGVVRLSVAEVIRRRDTRATPPMDLRTE